MKYIYKLSATLAILSGVTFFGGCTKDSTLEKATVSEAEVNFKPAVRSAERTKAVSGNVTETGVFTSEEGIAIPFTRTVENTASSCATKGALANTSGETMALNEAGINSFRICAVNGDGTVYIPCMKNVRYLDGKWQAERTYTWKEAEDKKFFAVANFGENISMTPDEDGSVNFKTALVIPDKAEEQKDFIFAQTVADGDSDNDGVIDGTVSLQFDHICTSVIFKCGTMTGVERIKSISIEGVTGCREYDVTFNADGSLNGESTETDIYTKTVYAIVDGELPAVGEAIDEPFILIPQNLESQPVTLRILATINGHDYELISEVHSGIWEAGKTNVYTLGLSQDVPVETEFLCFTSDGTQSVKFCYSTVMPVLEYSFNKTRWTVWADTEVPIEFGGGSRRNLYVRGNNPAGLKQSETFSFSSGDYVTVEFSNQEQPVAVSGSVMALIDYTTKLTEIPCAGCFVGLFSGQQCITSAPELPATTLTDYCYAGMFGNCTSLVSTPELPAEIMKERCYMMMFSSCTSLNSAPELNSTSLALGCYYGMFMDCTGLISASALPATTLAEECYMHMFNGCRNLESAPELPATQLKAFCYNQMFSRCEKITTAPELPAEVLVECCYYGMFNRCTSLSYIKMLAKDISGQHCLQRWVDGVSGNGTFIKAAEMTDLPSGDNGIPYGWTVENAGE